MLFLVLYFYTTFQYFNGLLVDSFVCDYRGESGAGKTENTKKVISYFAMVGARGGTKDSTKVIMIMMAIMIGVSLYRISNNFDMNGI